MSTLDDIKGEIEGVGSAIDETSTQVGGLITTTDAAVEAAVALGPPETVELFQAIKTALEKVDTQLGSVRAAIEEAAGAAGSS